MSLDSSDEENNNNSHQHQHQQQQRHKSGWRNPTLNDTNNPHAKEHQDVKEEEEQTLENQENLQEEDESCSQDYENDHENGHSRYFSPSSASSSAVSLAVSSTGTPSTPPPAVLPRWDRDTMGHGAQQQQQQDEMDSSRSRSSSTICSNNSSSSASSSSPVLNTLSSEEEWKEIEGIALLRQIFPDETTGALRQLHYQHMEQNRKALRKMQRLRHDKFLKSATNTIQQQQQQQQAQMERKSTRFYSPSSSSPTSSSSNHEISENSWKQQQHKSPFPQQEPGMQEEKKEAPFSFEDPPLHTRTTSTTTRNSSYNNPHWNEQINLPDDFLRLPTSIAVRRYNESTGVWRYELVQELEKTAILQHVQHYYHPTTYENHYDNTPYFSAVISRHTTLGLGMTLVEDNYNLLRVHSLSTTTTTSSHHNNNSNKGALLDQDEEQEQDERARQDNPSNANTNTTNTRFIGPSYEAGIRPGDTIIGINGIAFRQSMPPDTLSLLQHAAMMINFSVDPIVLHLRKREDSFYVSTPPPPPPPPPPPIRRLRTTTNNSTGDEFPRATSLLDETMDMMEENNEQLLGPTVVIGTPMQTTPMTPPRRNDDGPKSVSSSTTTTTAASATTPIVVQATPIATNLSSPSRRSSAIHPFAKALASRGLLRNKTDEWTVTRTLEHFTERARQWESTSSFRIDGTTYELEKNHFDPNDLPPEMAHFFDVPFSTTVSDEDGFSILPSVAPSTPTLSEHSPLIPRTYLEAFYGEYNVPQQQQQIHVQEGFDTGDEDAMSNNSRGWIQRRRPGQPLLFPGQRLRLRRLQQQQEQGQEQLQKQRLKLSPYLPSSGFSAALSPLQQQSRADTLFIPLMGVRKALSARILNTFIEGTRIAYTIWVYDVESGKEWYAPIRYFRDFQDLRSATMSLCPSSVGQLPFPKVSSGWGLVYVRTTSSWDESTESEKVREQKCRQLEQFLRGLCAMIYCHKLHPEVAEIAIHVQSFLGCEQALTNPNNSRGTRMDGDALASDSHHYAHQQQELNNRFDVVQQKQQLQGSLPVEEAQVGHTGHQTAVRLLLKRSIQRYTYRIFLLGTMRAIVDQFVNAERSKGPKVRDIESLEAEGRDSLKARAIEDIEKIRVFLDHVQDMILDGCMEDFESIAQRREFDLIRPFLINQQAQHGTSGAIASSHVHATADGASLPTESRSYSCYWDRLVREAVREQIEIEVYVPLRSVVSRLLVYGWRHEDMEVHFKMQELYKRPQGRFRIPSDKVSPSNWQSVAKILKQGVGMSTLPCAKLRAIVDAAREISRLYAEEHDTNNGVQDDSLLGADDFLPIFIFCVVRADMERPCALCVLLRTLCDRINRTGEIGYFLASFEAAITHIQEVDLTEDSEDMLSFLSVPLTEVSFNNYDSS